MRRWSGAMSPGFSGAAPCPRHNVGSIPAKRRFAMREPSISVIVPAYNEALNLPGVIAEIATELAAFGRPYEIVIVDDGSTDATLEVCLRLEHTVDRVRVVRHNTNRGLGGVYRTGFQE